MLKPSENDVMQIDTQTDDEVIQTDDEVIPLFLRIKKCKKVNKEKKTAIFITEDNEEIELKYKTISDPSYNTIFEKIFYDHLPKNKDIDGKKRLISLINGIFFPNTPDDGFKVKEIQYIQNKIVTHSRKDQRGTLIFDIPCICTCWNNEFKKNKKHLMNETLFGIDIELKINYQKKYVEKNYKYNVRLCSYSREPFIVISLLNFKDNATALSIYNKCNDTNDNNDNNDKNIVDENTGNKYKNFMSKRDSYRSVGVGPSYFDGSRNPSKLVEHIINNTFFFDLNDGNKDFLSNIPFLINCKEIDNTAKAWLKLFNLRNWSMKEDEVTLDKFVIPDDVEGLAKEVVEAIKILELISDNELEDAMLRQDEILETYEFERIEGKKEGLKEREIKIKDTIEESDRKIEKVKKKVEEAKEEIRKEREKKLEKIRTKIREEQEKKINEVIEEERKEREKKVKEVRAEAEKKIEEIRLDIRKEIRAEVEKLLKIETALMLFNSGINIINAKILFKNISDNQLKYMESFVKSQNVNKKDLANILEIKEDDLNNICIKLGLQNDKEFGFENEGKPPKKQKIN